MKKINAFTLAEVLITLGIIGIVAAMTIPTLVNKVQNIEYVAALKKFYTTQSSGWAQILADEGVQNLEDTSVFQSLPDMCAPVSIKDAVCSSFYNKLRKYFRFTGVIAPNYTFYTLSGDLDTFENYSGRTVIMFADGVVLYEGEFDKIPTHTSYPSQVTAEGGHMTTNQARLYIDVNGFKKPNKLGRDRFIFYLSGDGHIYPYGGKDTSLFFSGTLNETWQKQPFSEDCGRPNSDYVFGYYGWGCAARIMDDGWQMTY